MDILHNFSSKGKVIVDTVNLQDILKTKVRDGHSIRP